MPRWARYSLIAFIVVVVGLVPAAYFRSLYAHSKRLRVVEEGKLYRSGQLTANGFRDAVARLRIRTIVNLQEDFPDPDIPRSWLSSETIKESKLCKELGVNFVFIPPDLVPRREAGRNRPRAVEKLLEVLDNPACYPILIHCRAGLHRTGCMAAIYRMEYQGWTPQQAVQEMRRHGFGDQACTAANDYVFQYVLSYQPGLRHAGVAGTPDRSPVEEAPSIDGRRLEEAFGVDAPSRP